MKKLRSWEKHVELEKGVAWCGVELYSHMWSFIDADHALRSIIRNDRLQPCPACLTLIKKTVTDTPA